MNSSSWQTQLFISALLICAFIEVITVCWPHLSRLLASIRKERSNFLVNVHVHLMGPTLADLHHLNFNVTDWENVPLWCCLSYKKSIKKCLFTMIIIIVFQNIKCKSWKYNSKTLPSNLSALAIHESKTASIYVILNDFMLTLLCVFVQPQSCMWCTHFLIPTERAATCGI